MGGATSGVDSHAPIVGRQAEMVTNTEGIQVCVVEIQAREQQQKVRVKNLATHVIIESAIDQKIGILVTFKFEFKKYNK
ncbi:unnamed protein product [Phytophthora lilii]|uniref:Unnamed protein product n=1 Tax=Phytophthora lilii TaxID=2077276 RepID=A0A9W6XIN6_9STRA|nr:unnamed protein product [Phytophthora lilii]